MSLPSFRFLTLALFSSQPDFIFPFVTVATEIYRTFVTYIVIGIHCPVSGVTISTDTDSSLSALLSLAGLGSLVSRVL